MPEANWFEIESLRTYERMLPRLEPLITDEAERAMYFARLRAQFRRLFRTLHHVYGNRYDFFYHLEQILIASVEMYNKRSAELKKLDQQRESDTVWFQSESMLGGVCYVDLFAGNLQGVREKIGYFKELGLTYLHLMPLFKAPPEKNDGGYAVSNYREISAKLGTMEELAALASELRQAGISLVLDFVFNHTSDEHVWACRARDGDPEYQHYYLMFDDRTLPDQYEQTLREIFPEQDPGNFTYYPEIDKWVWTTFRRFQWDLNYANPAVFRAMMQEMLFLANRGVEVLRLDAVVFIWKQLGTGCENLPEVHSLIEAFNALIRVTAPAMIFKSEAIVHPDAVAGFISQDKCAISYHPTMMALLWESLATREIKLLRHSMEKRFAIPSDCAWVNYVRSHDDIGWTFADEDAAELWMNGFDHRQFLNRFYTGEFPGSFARGLPFNFNPETLDMRVSGTSASLAGLEWGLGQNDDSEIEYAIRRLLLVQSVVLSAGGIPLLYFGDEIGMCNDYSYRNDLAKVEDSRWVHRSSYNWGAFTRRHDPDTIEGRIFLPLLGLIKLRKSLPILNAHNPTQFFDPGNVHVLAFTRGQELLVLANFSEQTLTVPRARIDPFWNIPDQIRDLVSGSVLSADETLDLRPYQFMWLVAEH